MRVERVGADTRYEAIVALMRSARSAAPCHRWPRPTAGPRRSCGRVLLLAAAAGVVWSIDRPVARRVGGGVGADRHLPLRAVAGRALGAARRRRRDGAARRAAAPARRDRRPGAHARRCSSTRPARSPKAQLRLRRRASGWPPRRVADDASRCRRRPALAAWSQPPAGAGARAQRRCGERCAADGLARACAKCPGQGVRRPSTREGRSWRLGAPQSGSAIEPRPRLTAPQTCSAATAGRCCAFVFDERLRDDAAAAVRALRDDGVQVHLLSGDSAAPARTRIAARLGHRQRDGGMSPADKLAAVRAAQHARRGGRDARRRHQRRTGAGAGRCLVRDGRGRCGGAQRRPTGCWCPTAWPTCVRPARWRNARCACCARTSPGPRLQPVCVPLALAGLAAAVGRLGCGMALRARSFAGAEPRAGRPADCLRLAKGRGVTPRTLSRSRDGHPVPADPVLGACWCSASWASLPGRCTAASSTTSSNRASRSSRADEDRLDDASRRRHRRSRRIHRRRERDANDNGGFTNGKQRTRRCTTPMTPCAAFALAAVVWGVVGMLVGVVIAAQLAFPDLTYGIPWLSYGRLRPLHTNAVIFAFGGCALIATSYHVVQRTCQVPLFLPQARDVHLLGLAGGDRAGGDHAADGLHAGQGIRRARVADRPADRGGLGGRMRSSSSAPSACAACATSTSPTGSSAPSSSRWRCCTSSTARRCR